MKYCSESEAEKERFTMKAVAAGTNGLISRFKKIIRDLIEYCWSKIIPVTFIHSSDLMLPGMEGLTGTQIIVISRLMDIENRNAGKKFYWHTKIPEYARNIKIADDIKRQHDENFDRFLLAMKTRGYNPELSHITMAQRPVLGQADGTHRMGYLLSEKPNVFVPVQISSPITYLWYPVDGVSFFAQAGMPAEEIEQIKDRYQLLFDKMRRTITTVVKKNIFDANSRAIVQELENIGKRKGTKTAYQEKDNIKAPKQLKKVVKNTKELVIVEIEIEKQILYYKHGMLKSKIADEMADKLSKVYGKEYGYIAGTVTESILLETYLEENYSISSYTGDHESKNSINGEKN